MLIDTTPEMLVIKTVSTFAQLSRQTYEAIVGQYVQLFKLVWDNADGLTPQQVLDGFGTNAVKLFTASNDMLSYIAKAEDVLGILPRFAPVIPFAFTINEDGTATVGEPVGVE